MSAAARDDRRICEYCGEFIDREGELCRPIFTETDLPGDAYPAGPDGLTYATRENNP